MSYFEVNIIKHTKTWKHFHLKQEQSDHKISKKKPLRIRPDFSTRPLFTQYCGSTHSPSK